MALITENTSRTFHRHLFLPMLKTITLLKRNDDQAQGTVTPHKIYEAWRGQVFKTSETLQGDMLASHRTTWHLPRTELDRVGVHYINPLDVIVDDQGRRWQPEATTEIRVKLFQTHIDVDCLMILGQVLHG